MSSDRPPVLFEEIEALLKSRNNPVIESLNKTTLNELFEFLQPFKDAGDALEEEKRSALPLVVLYAFALKNFLEHAPVSAAEAVGIEKIKVRARHFLNTKLKISLFHKTATFHWPQFCQLRMLPEDERLEDYEHVRELLARVTEAMIQDEDETGDDVRYPASKIRGVAQVDNLVPTAALPEDDEATKGTKRREFWLSAAWDERGHCLASWARGSGCRRVGHLPGAAALMEDDCLASTPRGLDCRHKPVTFPEPVDDSARRKERGPLPGTPVSMDDVYVPPDHREADPWTTFARYPRTTRTLT
ncbi:hypothetical protein HPB47_023969 [Ixodes persulcatus]|uniref:Uncharacterized protein n=1 Tax=Ixodes persulcatus TaxID=34615 RepID=A0AC60Q5Y6_IXOPE|nr:hypothetical protein HPB47_023969 [Ixodes persulcatus]